MKIFLFLFGSILFGKVSAQWCGDGTFENFHIVDYHFDDTSMMYYDEFEFIQLYGSNYGVPMIIDTSNIGIWQVGVPNKGLNFDTAFSGDNVMITDSINPYPINNYSFFDLKVTANTSSSIRFKYKSDTDTLRDGFYLTISYDNGVNWLNYFDITLPNTPNNTYLTHECNPYFDTLLNGEIGISGTSLNWESIEVYDVHATVKNYLDTVIFRFNFISDSIDNGKKGIMIDNIQVFSTISFGSVDENEQTDFNLYPNPTTDFVTIDLVDYQEDYKDTYATILDLNGGVVKTIRIHNKITVTSLEDLKIGIYFIKIYNKNKSFTTKKFVITKK